MTLNDIDHEDLIVKNSNIRQNFLIHERSYFILGHTTAFHPLKRQELHKQPFPQISNQVWTKSLYNWYNCSLHVLSYSIVHMVIMWIRLNLSSTSKISDTRAQAIAKEYFFSFSFCWGGYFFVPNKKLSFLWYKSW